MKILHITASMDPKLGGVCQALKTMAIGLNTNPDVENEIVSFDDPDASFINLNSYCLHALGAGKGPWFQNAAYIPWLLQNLSNYDVVILHGLWNYQGFGLIKALHKLKKNAAIGHASFTTKFFVMPHGMLDPYFQKAAGRKLKAVRNWIYWKLIERKVVNQANGLLFTCEAELQLARETFSAYHPKNELVVGLGVEEPPVFTASMAEAFAQTCQELSTQPYLLFISRIHEKKGVDLLVDAYFKTNDHSNNETGHTSFIDPKSVSEKLIVAGPGLETLYGQKIKSAASKLSETGNQVFFPGMLTGEAKWGAFYGCEAFVLPSHQENFGIAVVEALACGKPVLISDQVNIHTEINTANAGLVAADTAEGTTQLLEKWHHMDQNQKTEMGKNARRCYEKYFAVEPAAKKLLAALAGN